MKRQVLHALCIVAAFASLCGCKHFQHASQWKSIDTLVAVIHPTEGNNARGWVKFRRTDGGVHIVAEISGLSPNAQHGFHIHDFGDATKGDGTSAGGHYNPESHDHSLPDAEHPRHAGDLGNLQADANGVARYDRTFSNISLVGMPNPIIGRGVIVHAKPDDGGQPVGNAGARIGIGVIGIANPG